MLIPWRVWEPRLCFKKLGKAGYRPSCQCVVPPNVPRKGGGHWWGGWALGLGGCLKRGDSKQHPG